MILGILGGGQLGMLLAQAANKIGIETFVYTCLLYTSDAADE